MSSQTGHRRDIDGLRAIAILPVILFHLGFRYTPGGFLGVDIFFVISGYLITSHTFCSTRQSSSSLKKP
jgi:peptidoglycan/LPS O-acetylase OafA/YrhL